jgi:hypothetical protein
MNNPYTSTMEPIVDPKWKSQIAPQVVPARRESSEVREMTGFPPARDDLGLGSRLREMTWGWVPACTGMTWKAMAANFICYRAFSQSRRRR